MVKPPYKKRYLRNTNTNEIHDTWNIRDACQLDKIPDDRVEWYDNREQALRSTRDANPCHWCMPEDEKEEYIDLMPKVMDEKERSRRFRPEPEIMPAPPPEPP